MESSGVSTTRPDCDTAIMGAYRLGEGERLAVESACRPPWPTQRTARVLLGEALPASIGHFRTSPCPCVNQKYGELGVEVPLRPNNKARGPIGNLRPDRELGL